MAPPPPKPAPAPRLYGILAAKAPIVLIFRRGPSDWFHLLRWHLDTGTLEPGVWVRKRVFPRRCDLSDDGRLMLYYLVGGFEGRYKVFAGLSRAPWLHSLVSWKEIGTWGRGHCFDTSDVAHTRGEPRVIGAKFGRVVAHENDQISYANERRRGWTEAADCPPRDPRDIWDEKRGVILEKTGGSGVVLRLKGGLWSTGGYSEKGSPLYELDLPTGERLDLPDAAWAEWDHAGRLLIATTDGHLRALGVGDATSDLAELETHDLRDLTPDPQAPPAWASEAPTGWPR